MGLLSRIKTAFGSSKQDEKATAILQLKEKRISELEQENERLKESAMAAESIIKSKEEQIAEIEKEVNRIRHAATLGESSVKAKEDQIARLESEIAALKEQQKQMEARKYAAIDASEDVSAEQETETPYEGSDPYQQLGQELFEALEKTIRKEENESS